MATQNTPTFSPVGGTYLGTQSVTITSPGATTIYYTTDGTLPSTSSSVYATPLTVSSNQTLTAFAVKAGVFNSAVGRANYTINQCMAAWKANEGSGSAVADSSGHTNNSTTTATWSGALSPLADSLVYAGAQLTQSTSALSFAVTQPFSVAAWVKRTTTTPANQTIISNLDVANNFRGWEVFANNSPTNYGLIIIDTNPTKVFNAFNSVALAINTLRHLVITYDGSGVAAGIKIYVNGVSVATTTSNTGVSTTTTNTVKAYMGARSDGTVPFTGNMGEVAVFNRVLTAREAATMFAEVYLPGTTYYVSATGSDAAAGTSPATAWQTITKVNAHTFIAGDTVLFNGGDTFSGTLSLTLQGTADFPITLGSYGSGNGIISSTTGDGLDLANSENYVIQNLTFTGSGWTGTQPSITVLNGGYGIHATTSFLNTSAALVNCFVQNCVISGYWYGCFFDNGWSNATNGLAGWNRIVVSNCNISNNLSFGLYTIGFGAEAGGSVNQLNNIQFLNNTFVNIPGDPNSGSGGVHGANKTEAQAIGVLSTTGGVVQGNYCSGIGGWGGFISGLTLGGSTAMAASNARNIVFAGNEVTLTNCSTKFDGSAYDLDQDCQNCTVAYNLSYNNVGPAVQWGSFGGKTTQSNLIHHNISYNDVRGNNNAGTLPEQGVIRLFGNGPSNSIFNNTIYLGSGTVGTPCCIGFEVGTQNGNIFANNLMVTVGGITFIRGNTVTSPTHIGTQSIIGNMYDSSGGSLIISNDNGTVTGNITTLAAWQAAGFELLGGVTPEGTTGASMLSNISGFSPPATGFLNHAGGLPGVNNFDLLVGSAAIASGVDPSLIAGGPTLVGLSDWHGLTLAAPFNMGALQSTGSPASGTGGRLELLLLGVGS